MMVSGFAQSLHAEGGMEIALGEVYEGAVVRELLVSIEDGMAYVKIGTLNKTYAESLCNTALYVRWLGEPNLQMSTEWTMRRAATEFGKAGHPTPLTREVLRLAGVEEEFTETTPKPEKPAPLHVVEPTGKSAPKLMSTGKRTADSDAGGPEGYSPEG